MPDEDDGWKQCQQIHPKSTPRKKSLTHFKPRDRQYLPDPEFHLSSAPNQIFVKRIDIGIRLHNTLDVLPAQHNFIE